MRFDLSTYPKKSGILAVREPFSLLAALADDDTSFGNRIADRITADLDEVANDPVALATYPGADVLTAQTILPATRSAALLQSALSVAQRDSGALVDAVLNPLTDTETLQVVLDHGLEGRRGWLGAAALLHPAMPVARAVAFLGSSDPYIGACASQHPHLSATVAADAINAYGLDKDLDEVVDTVGRLQHMWSTYRSQHRSLSDQLTASGADPDAVYDTVVGYGVHDTTGAMAHTYLNDLITR